MAFKIENEQRQMVQVLGGLGGIMVSGGNETIAMIGAVVAIEALAEEPVRRLINSARKERAPIK